MTPVSILSLIRRCCAATLLPSMPQGILGLPRMAGLPAPLPCHPGACFPTLSC